VAHEKNPVRNFRQALDQPQRQLPMMAFVPLDEVLQAGGDVRELQVEAPADLPGDIFRDV
jgi:hypothetical protein